MKPINENATAIAAMNLKVNHQTRTIEMNKTFADKASRFGSDEYDALMLAREQNPGYATKVITRKTTKSDKPSYCPAVRESVSASVIWALIAS